jgi:peroxiredoxin
MEQFLVLSSVMLWVVVVCNLVLTLALVRRVNSGSLPQKGLKEGHQAPNFTAETLRGEIATLATYAQREVAFVFVEPGCGPCREALPSYEALGPKAAQSGVDLVLVSTADTERTRRFVDEFSIKLPILIAPHDSNPFMKDYEVSGTPFYCLIDRQGKVQSAGSPNLRWGKWKALAEAWEGNVVHSASLATSETIERR